MAVKFTNNAATTLAAGINSSVTSIAVTDGSVFPTITGSDHFYVTFDDTTNKEIVKVTARSGNTLTVVRGHDNTTARAFSSGDKAELRIVAALLEDVKTDVTSTLTVDTFTGNGSATAFTLSVAPASEDNLIVFIEGVYQNPGDFTLSGTTLTLDVAPANSRKIIVYHVAALVSGNNLTHNQFTCNGSTTAFTLSLSPIHENNTQVFLDGVYQQKTDYAVSGTTLTMDTAPANGAILEVMTFTQTDVNTLPATFVSGLTQVTAVGADHFMIFDATDSALKKSLVSDVLESATSISTSADATAITIDSSENVTFTNNVTINSGQLTAGGLAYPTSDGTNGQVLTTNGSGTLSFTTIDTSISANSVGITELNVSDGSNGQALVTDGSGTLSFSTISSGATDINGLSDAKTFGTDSIMLGSATTGTINAANYNTGLGVGVFNALTSGDENVMVGFAAGQTLTTGGHNIGIGVNAVDDCSTGSFNVGIGTHAVGSTTTASNNVGVGYAALFANTTGTDNTAMGSGALDANTTAANNTAIGSGALTANTTATANVAVGHAALFVNTTGANNTAVGKSSMLANTTASHNTAVGYNSLVANTTGTQNNAFGSSSLAAVTTGSYNCGFGQATLASCTTGHSNTALGDNASQFNTTGYSNISIGVDSGRANTTGAENVCVGILAGRYHSANYNTFLGSRAGYQTTSSENVIIGAYGGSSNTSSYHHVIIGYNAQSNHASSSNTENVIGHGVTGIGSGYNTLGGNANRTYNQQGSASWSGTSDERLKTDVVNEPLGLSFINDLRPVKFKWKKKKDVDSSTFPTIYEEGSEERVQPTEHGVDKHGFLAQELESTIANYADAGDAGHEIFKQTTDGVYTASPSALIPMLVKALQEADNKIDALTTRIEALEN